MRLIVTGGGTGGHLFPAIAVASGLRKRLAGSTVLFIGTGRRLDDRALAGLDFERQTITFSGVKGLGAVGAIRAAFRLPLALLKAGRIISRFKPDLIFGVGGYVTGPVLLAAKMLRVPICIHEQNSVPGLANRLAGRIADRVCISLPCKPPFAEKKTVLTGNPVRREILTAAVKKTTLKEGTTLTLLILGGSQGAHRVNELVLEAVGILRAAGVQINVIHQTGASDEEMVRQGYAAIGQQAEVADFFSDMVDLYNRADLVVSRAGATSLAELAVMGIPALLVPYPYAADDHQTGNAGYYVHSGGAKVFQESELNGEQLAGEITALAQNNEQLQIMAGAMRSQGKPEATELILDVCEQLVG
jgi:UDP-N-acetylglucosamine--N-acetylmuramyl-(pentapeptide) pyrophosphoryl-undecaprenol N-acetylglucosamine transferase